MQYPLKWWLEYILSKIRNKYIKKTTYNHTDVKLFKHLKKYKT